MSKPWDTMTDDELNSLAGEYVLGTLSGDKRAELQSRMDRDPALLAAVQYWENRLTGLNALTQPVEPPAHVWARIAASTAATAATAAATAAPTARATVRPGLLASLWNNLNVWRGLGLGGAAAAAALSVVLMVQGPHSGPSVKYVVVLVAPQANTPGWVVHARDSRYVELIPLGMQEVPEDKALQFWTKADGWAGPVSLGLVKPGQPLRVPVDSLPPLTQNQLFELTLEPYNGSPIGKPTGPVQFIGRSVKVDL